MKFTTTALLFSALLPVFTNGALEEENIFELGNTRPEGIDILPQKIGKTLGLGSNGDIAIWSELFWGGINAINLKTGEQKVIVNRNPPFTQGFPQGAVGVKYYKGAIFACGGFDGADGNVRAYDIHTGHLIQTCNVGQGGFINDLTFIDEKAYITNSFSNSLAVLDAEKMIEDGDCVVNSIPLTAGFPLDFTSFNANGIVPYKDGLLIANYYLGGVYYLDLSSGADAIEVIPAGQVLGADGLAITSDESKLFVCQNKFNAQVGDRDAVSAYTLDGMTATLDDEFVNDPILDAPAACALTEKEDAIYFVNSRFDSLVGFPAVGENEVDSSGEPLFGETFKLAGLSINKNN